MDSSHLAIIDHEYVSLYVRVYMRASEHAWVHVYVILLLDIWYLGRLTFRGSSMTPWSGCLTRVIFLEIHPAIDENVTGILNCF